MSPPPLVTPAIILRRVAYGDYDLILTLLSRSEGKLSVIAKSAKKSVKRFAGILEPFSILDIICTIGRNKGLPVLQEATLTHPFTHIRGDVNKTAYAGYWSEIISMWMMEGKKESALYHLLLSSLKALDSKEIPDTLLSLAFQIKFLSISGLTPNLECCMQCRQPIDQATSPYFSFDPRKGGLVCRKCAHGIQNGLPLSKGTIKLLAWLTRSTISHIQRVRYSPASIEEGQAFLETLIPSHLGKKPKSLTFLHNMRPAGEKMKGYQR
jgi:DNA repair protein RecO (recombination protein O)